jgi:tetratricopeptide (TPR) repeat protein
LPTPCDEVLADFDRALEIDPDDVTALASRGEIYLISGSFDEARAALTRAVEIDPDITHDLVNRFVNPAVTRLRNGDPGAAATISEDINQIFPNNGKAHNNFAFCLLPIYPLRALEEFDVRARRQRSGYCC